MMMMNDDDEDEDDGMVATQPVKKYHMSNEKATIFSRGFSFSSHVHAHTLSPTQPPTHRKAS